MTRVITYGTYDLFHKGHLKLLERAKALGDYLIVGVTADSFDRVRGKINVQQTLIERIEAVRATGLADEIIVEEYEGQKIDDIKRFNVDIFTVGSDWRGHFDYLNEYCQVVYLERTQGISSSDLRTEERKIRMGIVGESSIINKIILESKFVNGLTISSIYSLYPKFIKSEYTYLEEKSYETLLEKSDAVYIISNPLEHYSQIKSALLQRKHVICESPIATNIVQYDELRNLASANGCILMDAVKTAYSTAYYRLLLLAKSGRIGDIVSIDVTCTSMENLLNTEAQGLKYIWNSINSWGPTAMLPIFQLLGTDYKQKSIISRSLAEDDYFDSFTQINFVYEHAVATLRVGQGVKSEGELIISGTNGYIYVPAPWWKTDYFEIRFENPQNNKRYFYQLDGEGIRYQLVSFVKMINLSYNVAYVDDKTSKAIVRIIEDFYNRKDYVEI